MAQESKAKSIIIGGIFLFLALLTLIGCGKTRELNNTIYRFNSDVTHKTIDNLLISFNKANRVISRNETFTLFINSLGGRVTAFNNFKHEFANTKLKLITKVHTFAASAGAFMFIRGDVRIMRERALLLFHYARINYRKVEITVSLIKKYLKGKVTSIYTLSVLNKLGKTRLKKIMANLSKSNKTIYEYTIKYIGKKAADKVLVDGKDITLTAKKALSLGIINRIERQRS